MTLCDIALKHRTDKTPHFGGCSHSYTPFYAALLADLQVNSLLEIGIYEGGSLRMWEEYLPSAAIYGIDIDANTLVNGGRIRSFQCDQSDASALLNTVGSLGGFDFIVDDGSHMPEHQIISANTLMPLLHYNGVYVIEDVQPGCSDFIRQAIPYPSRVFEFCLSRWPDDRLIVIKRW